MSNHFVVHLKLIHCILTAIEKIFKKPSKRKERQCYVQQGEGDLKKRPQGDGPMDVEMLEGLLQNF